MKRLFSFILSVVLALSLLGCSQEEQPKQKSELEQIEEILGKIANDYLDTDITIDEADKKLAVVKARVDVIDEDKLESDEKSELLSVSIDVLTFESQLFKARSGRDYEIDEIVEIRDKYYDE